MSNSTSYALIDFTIFVLLTNFTLNQPNFTFAPSLLADIQKILLVLIIPNISIDNWITPNQRFAIRLCNF